MVLKILTLRIAGHHTLTIIGAEEVTIYSPWEPSTCPLTTGISGKHTSQNTEFVSGDTDLRGIFIADGIRGIPTVIARDKSNRYAFYRGKDWVGPSEKEDYHEEEPGLSQDFDDQYRGNLFKQQNMMQEENRANLDFLYDQEIEGVMVQEMK